MAQFDNTEEWKLYELGVDYNTRIDLYANNELNWNMYNGKQWLGVAMNGLSKWTFNVCRSTINYFISFICSQKVKMQYSAENVPDEPTDQQDMKIKEFVTLMSNMADMKWEKDKMDSKLRELMLDGANTGDFAAIVYWDKDIKTGQAEKGDFTTDVINGQDVLFGNPNDKNVEPQPYILVAGRDMVSTLKAEAKANKVSQDLIESITPDVDTTYQAGSHGKIELDGKEDNGKCNYIIKFWKKDGQVYWNKSTRYCPIRKDINLGISRYPIAWGNWETVKNSYHGMPVIDGIIDNQLSINQMFAMISYWMKMFAFGKVMIDKARMPGYTNKIGTVYESPNPLDDTMFKQLQAGNFNEAILRVIEMAIKFTKEFIGYSDALMGQINPEQASGTAIIATTKQASLPLGNISANRDQFVEDLGLIWGEFFLKKYRDRKVSYRDKEKVVTTQYVTDGMQDILLRCKVDVGPSNFVSEISGIQSLDNLLKMGTINKLQYFERMAKMNVIPDCQGLVKDSQAEMQQQQAMAQQQLQQQTQQQQPPQQTIEEYFNNLPPEIQQHIQSMKNPEEVIQAMMPLQGEELSNFMAEIMKGGGNN